MSFNVQPSVSKNLYNYALTSNGWNSSPSFLRGCSWVIILNLTRIKFSTSFLKLINILSIGDIAALILLKRRKKSLLWAKDATASVCPVGIRKLGLVCHVRLWNLLIASVSWPSILPSVKGGYFSYTSYNVTRVIIQENLYESVQEIVKLYLNSQS